MAAQTLTPEEREGIVLDLKAGYTVTSIAEYYGVSRQNVYYLRDKYLPKKDRAKKKRKQKKN